MTTVTKSKSSDPRLRKDVAPSTVHRRDTAAENASDEDEHQDDGSCESDSGHAEATDRLLGEVEQVSAPEHPDDGRRDEAAEQSGAEREGGDDGQEGRAEQRHQQRSDQRIRADRGIEPGAQDDDRGEQQRMPRSRREAAGDPSRPNASRISRHLLLVHAERRWRAALGRRLGQASVGGSSLSRPRSSRRRWSARVTWVRKKNGTAMRAARAAWITIVPAPGSM